MLAEELLPPAKTSWKKVLATLPEVDQTRLLDRFKEDEVLALRGDFFLNARREQMAPVGNWFIWIILSGRGWGKNYSASNWLINKHIDGEAKNSAIVAATATDLRRFCIEGPSGILAQAPKWFYPENFPSKLKLVWPNGTETHYHTSEKPARLRGPNYDTVWCDELSYWRYLDEAWDNLMMTLRFGQDVQCMISMTPRPIKAIRELVKREGTDVVVTRGSTYDNADNLSDKFLEKIEEQYEGTRKGRQELHGELLEEAEGALWSIDMLDLNRVKAAPELIKISVALDPSTTAGENSDEAGIVVGGISSEKHGYVLADYTGKLTPNEWAKKAVDAYNFHEANDIVAEKNQGGEMISSMIHNIDPLIKVHLVHASQGKVARAEPVSMLDEQGKIHHVGSFPLLEDEMCNFVPGEVGTVGRDSPNRVDARVWLFKHLLVTAKGRARAWGRKAA